MYCQCMRHVWILEGFLDSFHTGWEELDVAECHLTTWPPPLRYLEIQRLDGESYFFGFVNLSEPRGRNGGLLMHGNALVDQPSPRLANCQRWTLVYPNPRMWSRAMKAKSFQSQNSRQQVLPAIRPPEIRNIERGGESLPWSGLERVSEVTAQTILTPSCVVARGQVLILWCRVQFPKDC